MTVTAGTVAPEDIVVLAFDDGLVNRKVASSKKHT